MLALFGTSFTDFTAGFLLAVCFGPCTQGWGLRALLTISRQLSGVNVTLCLASCHPGQSGSPFLELSLICKVGTVRVGKPEAFPGIAFDELQSKNQVQNREAEITGEQTAFPLPPTQVCPYPCMFVSSPQATSSKQHHQELIENDASPVPIHKGGSDATDMCVPRCTQRLVTGETRLKPAPESPCADRAPRRALDRLVSASEWTSPGVFKFDFLGWEFRSWPNHNLMKY